MAAPRNVIVNDNNNSKSTVDRNNVANRRERLITPNEGCHENRINLLRAPVVSIKNTKEIQLIFDNMVRNKVDMTLDTNIYEGTDDTEMLDLSVDSEGMGTGKLEIVSITPITDNAPRKIYEVLMETPRITKERFSKAGSLSKTKTATKARAAPKTRCASKSRPGPKSKKGFNSHYASKKMPCFRMLEDQEQMDIQLNPTEWVPPLADLQVNPENNNTAPDPVVTNNSNNAAQCSDIDSTQEITPEELQPYGSNNKDQNEASTSAMAVNLNQNHRAIEIESNDNEGNVEISIDDNGNANSEAGASDLEPSANRDKIKINIKSKPGMKIDLNVEIAESFKNFMLKLSRKPIRDYIGQPWDGD